jgi:uncharacterized protein
VATGATPLLALYLPPLEAAALLLPIVLCQDAVSVHAYWRGIAAGLFWRTIAAKNI